MMLALGLFVFELRTLPYQEMQRSMSWRHAEQSRVGERPALQFTGPDADTITLTGTVINGTGENGVTAFDATGRSNFFAPARSFIGAAQNQTGFEAAFRGWTCNSSVLDFGSATGACTTLPVYS